MPLIQWSFYSLNARSTSAIFLRNWTQCVDGFSLYNKGMLKKVMTQNNTQLSFVTERTQFNAAHAQLLENSRPVAFAETCR